MQVLISFIWTGMLFHGMKLYSSLLIYSPDLPHDIQLRTFVIIPGVMVLLNVVSIFFAQRIPVVLIGFTFVIQIFFAFGIFMLAGGGI